MSQENVEIVRQPITLRAHTRRRLEERLALRFPGAVILLVRAVWRLPPRSRLRQAYLRRAVQLGFEALNRDDVEAAFATLPPGGRARTASRSSSGSASIRPIVVAKSA